MNSDFPFFFPFFLVLLQYETNATLHNKFTENTILMQATASYSEDGFIYFFSLYVP